MHHDLEQDAFLVWGLSVIELGGAWSQTIQVFIFISHSLFFSMNITWCMERFEHEEKLVEQALKPCYIYWHRKRSGGWGHEINGFIA